MDKHATPDMRPPAYADVVGLLPSTSNLEPSAPQRPSPQPQQFPPPQSMLPAGQPVTTYPPQGAPLLPQQAVYQYPQQQVMQAMDAHNIKDRNPTVANWVFAKTTHVVGPK